MIKGGAEYQSRILADFLKDNNKNVFFISYDKSFEDGVLTKDGFRVYLVNVKSSFFEKAFLYPKVASKIKEIIDLEAPDIIYQRVLNTFSFRISGYAQKKDIPYHLHVADNYSVTFKGLKGVMKKYIFKKIVNRGTKLIAQTHTQIHLINKVVDVHITQISNFHPTMLDKPLSKDMTKIVWIGNGRPVKRLELFLDLAEQFRGSNLVFHIYGKIPEDKYGQYLKARIESLLNVTAYGQKSNDFINLELRNALCLINTSQSEGFSNTFIQAWMSGTPVISLNSDPNGLLSKNNLGYYCGNEFNILKKSLGTMLERKDYTQLCQDCLDFSNENFGLKKNAMRFLQTIDKSTNERG